jgi:DNA-binding response OmpR family regulator
MHTATSPLSLNLRTLQLQGPEGWVNVTDPECVLLRAFTSSVGQRLETAAMLHCVGKACNPQSKRALEVQLVRLRKKLEQAGAPAPTIKAIRGFGYQLCFSLVVLSAPNGATPAHVPLLSS